MVTSLAYRWKQEGAKPCSSSPAPPGASARRSSTACSSGSPPSRSGSASATSATRGAGRAWRACPRGRLHRPGHLAHAFEGAEQVLVISASIRGDGAITANHAALDAAHAAGRGSSTPATGRGGDSLFDAARARAARGDLAAGVPFVALRNGFYAHARAVRGRGARRAGRRAEDGRSLDAHEDLARGAIALTRRAGRVTPADGARHAGPGAVAGAGVRARRRVCPTTSGGAAMSGAAAAVVEFTLGMFRAARAARSR